MKGLWNASDGRILAQAMGAVARWPQSGNRLCARGALMCCQRGVAEVVIAELGCTGTGAEARWLLPGTWHHCCAFGLCVFATLQ